MPPAIRAFLESTDWEDAVRNAVSLGGDSDTLACITGGIAEAAYGVPAAVEQEVMTRLEMRSPLWLWRFALAESLAVEDREFRRQSDSTVAEFGNALAGWAVV